MSESYYVGVDVGTGSVRAALVSPTGKVIKTSTRAIKTWNDQPDYFEQSSDDIWECCCIVVREVTLETDPSNVKGVGFDATCSLVAIGEDNQPITVSSTGFNERNIVLWMDHRASAEAEFINKIKPKVLKYVGGSMSLEMQTPKLAWLKKNLRNQWENTKYFFDLPDFLTWRATSDDSRSLCSVVCKWTFIAGQNGHIGWDKEYFSLIGLDDLLEKSAIKIGSRVKSPGERCGHGLTVRAATELGLLEGTPVGTSIIDAHAGGLGLLGCSAPGISELFQSRLGLICGTSTCHMAVTDDPLLVPGVWGPYYSAMVPGLWLNEAGQSATGKLVDHVIDSHPAATDIKSKTSGSSHIYQYLNLLLNNMAKDRGVSSPDTLTNKLHIWPDFHGNRSPLADPTLLGMISGLSLSNGEEDLAIKYLATIQALAYGTRHILDTLTEGGYTQFSSALLCGGLSKNPVFVQTHADVLGLPVLLPQEPESVLVGAAILGGVASGDFETVQEAVLAMGGPATVVQPLPENIRYHEKKYKVFLKMVEDQKSYDKIMNQE